MFDWLGDKIDAILKWFTDFIWDVLQWLKDVPLDIFETFLEAIRTVLSSVPVPEFAQHGLQALSGFFSVSFNGDCSPINFNFTVYSQAFDIAIDPFCNLTIWPYIRAVVMCVFGFFAFRVGFDN